MKHNYPFFIMTFIAVASLGLNIFLILNPREILIENKLSKKEQNNLISMMLETENGKYEESIDNTWPSDKYKLNEELSGCENGSEIIWDKETKSIKVSATSSDKCYAYFDHLTLSEYILSTYKKDGDNNLYYHDGQGNYTNSNLEAGDFSYRYSGASKNVNNYICFGGDCSNNPAEASYKYLYRIIGLFKNNEDQYELKIIKADAATKEDLGNKDTQSFSAYSGDHVPNGSYYNGKLGNYANYCWNNTDSAHVTADDNTNVSMWKESNLNKINLNIIFYESIKESYQKIISKHEWQVGGYDDPNHNAKETYNQELGSDKLTTESIKCYTQGSNVKNQAPRPCNQENDLTYKAYIGLMYISDYMYGSIPDNWNTVADNYSQDDVKNNDWMYLGVYEWSISRYTGHGRSARLVYDTGTAYNGIYVFSSSGVRPVMYLSVDAKISGGLGTENEPYKIAIN